MNDHPGGRPADHYRQATDPFGLTFDIKTKSDDET
jgi:hypothetical protein